MLVVGVKIVIMVSGLTMTDKCFGPKLVGTSKTNKTSKIPSFASPSTKASDP